MQRLWVINGNNINYDHDITASTLLLLVEWVIEGFDVVGSWSGASLSPWKALVKCVRINWETFMAYFQSTEAVPVNLTGTKKVYISVDQAKIDNGVANSEDGTWIASIQTGASYPWSNDISLYSVDSGVVTDERVYVNINGDMMDKILITLGGTFATISYVDSEIALAWSIPSISENTFLLWETIVKDDHLFVEETPTYAMATNRIGVGDNSARTKISIPVIWNWVPFNWITVSLQKHGSPSTTIEMTVEYDTWFAPNGTQYTNWIANLAPWSVSTSVTDKTFDMYGYNYVTIPEWVLAWIVIYQQYNTVNASNYYSIWYAPRDTSTRKTKVWNGSAWSLFGGDNFVYINSIGFHRNLLSKSIATVPYKLPYDNISRIAQTGWSIWQKISLSAWGLHKFTTPLLANTLYYQSNVAGALSTTAGTNNYKVWYTNNNGELFIEKQLQYIGSVAITTSTTILPWCQEMIISGTAKSPSIAEVTLTREKNVGTLNMYVTNNNYSNTYTWSGNTLTTTTAWGTAYLYWYHK